MLKTMIDDFEKTINAMPEHVTDMSQNRVNFTCLRAIILHEMADYLAECYPVLNSRETDKSKKNPFKREFETTLHWLYQHIYKKHPVEKLEKYWTDNKEKFAGKIKPITEYKQLDLFGG